jgi:signal transduction histidine kinase
MMVSHEADALRDEVCDALSNVYHDMNNPLAVIAGNVQFLHELIRDEDLDAQIEVSINDIGEATQRLSDALDDLLRLRKRIGGEGA